MSIATDPASITQAQKAAPRLRLPVAIRNIVHSWSGRIGLLLLAIVVALTIFGPLLAPHDPTQTLGLPGASPDGRYLLGLDSTGRDVLSRLLNGGRSTLTLSMAATALTYGVGILLGLVAGASHSFVDSVIMRGVDVLLSLPALLIILLLRTGFGNSSLLLIGAAALVLMPGVARITRTAALEVSTAGYVEAAIGRGESTGSLLVREILPNIRGTLIADLGVRFSWAIILIASVNFLGVGLEPPASDWGLMVSENRDVIGSNPLSVAAPALVLGILIIGLNLLGDAYGRDAARSEESR